MRILARNGTTVILALSLSACGTLYKLEVAAASDPSANFDKTYVLLSGNSGLDMKSPEFNEYSAQIERALSLKGYQRLGEDQLSAAAVGIYLSVGMGDPSRRVHTVSQGLYETPYAENSTAVVRASGNNSGGGGQSGQQQSNPVSTPAPEVLTGYQNTGFATTVYTKHLSLVAIDFPSFVSDVARVGRENAKPRTIWSIDVETTGQPSDLSEVVPVMIAAATPYVGTTTDGFVQVKLSSDDKRIQAIKESEHE